MSDFYRDNLNPTSGDNHFFKLHNPLVVKSGDEELGRFDGSEEIEIDIPQGSSGGESSWKLVSIINTSADAGSNAEYKVNKDLDGNDFSLDELLFYSPSITTTNYFSICLNGIVWSSDKALKTWFASSSKVMVAKILSVVNFKEFQMVIDNAIRRHALIENANCLNNQEKITSFSFAPRTAVDGQTVYVFGR